MQCKVSWDINHNSVTVESEGTFLKYEFLDSKNPKKHVLHIIVGQLVEKLKFKMADGGYFGFEALTHSARPFAIGAYKLNIFFNLYR